MISRYMTIVSGRYALRALALFHSLKPYLASEPFVVYCIDEDSADVLKCLVDAQLQVVESARFETDELRRIRAERSTAEYCWALKPVILEHSMASAAYGSWMVYLDSDILAFGNPDNALEPEVAAHVVITPHRHANDYFQAFEESTGRFNAGYIAFRASETGRAALSWWRDRCIEATPIVPSDHAYADQKYLDRLEGLFEGVAASSHKGLNAGPWNVIDRPVDRKGTTIRVDGYELLLFHMQGFKFLGRCVHDCYAGPVKIGSRMRDLIYRPYATEICRCWDELESYVGYKQQPDVRLGDVRTLLREFRKFIRGRSNLMFVQFKYF
jgi:hypothetical protein